MIVLDLHQTQEMVSLNADMREVGLALAHLPWELLHDGSGFLVQDPRLSVLPTRVVSGRVQGVFDKQNRPLRLVFLAMSPVAIEPVLDYEREEANILAATDQSTPEWTYPQEDEQGSGIKVQR